jgi:hypothetical protein
LQALHEEQARARAQAELDAAARHERLAAEVEAKVSEVVREVKAAATESSVVVAAVADAGSEILPAPAWSAVTERCTALEQAVAQLDEACAGTLEEAGVLPSSLFPLPTPFTSPRPTAVSVQASAWATRRRPASPAAGERSPVALATLSTNPQLIVSAGPMADGWTRACWPSRRRARAARWVRAEARLGRWRVTSRC